MPKLRGRGRPKRSTSQKNHQQKADGKLDVFISMVPVVPECKILSDPSLIFMSCVSDTSVKPMRRGRGRTRGLRVQMKRQQSADGKLDVLIHPKKLVAVGPGRKDFITDLSVIVRQNARHNVCKWKRVPQSTRDTIVQKILVCSGISIDYGWITCLMVLYFRE